MLAHVRELFERPPLPGLAAVYLFGSRAAGRTHAESDVDIGVLLDRASYPTPADRFAARLALIAAVGSRLTAELDLVILNDAPPLLGRAIITDGLPVAIYDAAATHAYRRDVQLFAADIEPFIERHRRRLLAELIR